MTWVFNLQCQNSILSRMDAFAGKWILVNSKYPRSDISNPSTNLPTCDLRKVQIAVFLYVMQPVKIMH